MMTRCLAEKKSLQKAGPDPEKEDEVMLVRERVSRIYYNRHFFDYPISMKPETIKNMGMFTTFKAGMSYLGSCIKKRPETNLENFYINRFEKYYTVCSLRATRKNSGAGIREKYRRIGGTQRVKGLSIRAIIKDIFSKIFGKKDNSSRDLTY